MNDYDTQTAPVATNIFAAIAELAEAEAGPKPFTADYTQSENTRVLRRSLHVNDGGRATVTFAGCANLDTLWVEGNSLYAEVDQTEDYENIETVIEVAVLPTGKRIPSTTGHPLARRLGSVKVAGKVTHTYLLDAGLWARTRVSADDDGGIGGAADSDA